MVHKTNGVLVVDDESAMLSAIREYFECRGVMVDCAHELEEAQALLTKRRYSAVITDLRMTAHGDEGFHLVDEIRERSPNTRILLLTGYNSPEIRAEAIRRGVDAVLSKPTSLASLARIASKWEAHA